MTAKAPPPKPAGNSKLIPFYQEPKAEERKKAPMFTLIFILLGFRTGFALLRMTLAPLRMAFAQFRAGIARLRMTIALFGVAVTYLAFFIRY
jgi:hypothetical protein